jgi:hypothetical protein
MNHNYDRIWTGKEIGENTFETRHGISLSFYDPDSIVGHTGICHQEYAGFPLSDFHVDKQIVADLLSRLINSETLLNYHAGAGMNLSCMYKINSTVYKEDNEFPYTSLDKHVQIAESQENYQPYKKNITVTRRIDYMPGDFHLNIHSLLFDQLICSFDQGINIVRLADYSVSKGLNFAYLLIGHTSEKYYGQILCQHIVLDFITDKSTIPVIQPDIHEHNIRFELPQGRGYKSGIIDSHYVIPLIQKQ